MLVVTGVAFLSKYRVEVHMASSLHHLVACQLQGEFVPAATLQTTQKLARDRGFHVGPESDSPLIQAGSMGKKWRSERNFWIAFICFTLWW